MLTLVGILIILVIVGLLVSGKVNPILAMSAIPFIGAIIAGFDLTEISKFFEAGITKVTKVAVMFLFAILFFSILKELKVFNPFIKFMISLTRGNVIVVAIITTLIAALVHLDGSGAATFLIIIPALLPIYKNLGMSPYLMLMLMAGSMGVMNMVPWGGPLGRASAVTGIEASVLWQSLIPVQIAGVAFMVVFAIIMGTREKYRIAAAQKKGTTPFQQDCSMQDFEPTDATTCDNPPQRFIANCFILVLSIILLAFGILSAPYIFMLALSITLLINYKNPKERMSAIARHSPQALSMVAIIFSAGAFLGILTGTGMLKSIAVDLIYILPAQWIGSLHIFIGMIGVPMDLFTSTDAYYFALLPIVQEITATSGISSESVIYAMAIGNNAGTFVSPFSPATWLAMGLAGTEMGRHLKYSFGWIWLFSLFPLFVGYLLGLY